MARLEIRNQGTSSLVELGPDPVPLGYDTVGQAAWGRGRVVRQVAEVRGDVLHAADGERRLTPGERVDVGGLEVRTPEGWTAVEPIEGGFVCNLGDMLERMTGGRYRSTPHRVRPPAEGPDRLSFPFFFDPGWDVEVGPLPLDGPAPAGDPTDRWDRTSVHDWSGTYGDYLTAKVRRVFPDLDRRQ